MNLELTSVLTQSFSILLAVIFIFGTLLLWPKLYRKGLVNLGVRFLVLVLTLMLSIVSLGISVNKSQGFYSSWSDLFGQTVDFKTTAITNSNLTRIDNSFIKQAKPIGVDLYLVKDVITGKDSQVSNVVYLILPATAIDKIKAGQNLDPKNYQVTEFLTGFPSQPEMWLKSLKVEQEISTFNSAHAKQIIGVIPQINIAGNYDLECMNLSNGQPDAETWLTQDMHTYVNTRLGLPDSRWMVIGVSTGAWCASMFSMKHPDLYLGAVSIAGYYRPALPLKDPISLQNAMIAKYDVGKMEAKLTSVVPIYMVASRGDIYSYRETTRFLVKSHPMLNINYIEIATGGHNPKVWKGSILPGLEWLSSF